MIRALFPCAALTLVAIGGCSSSDSDSGAAAAVNGTSPGSSATASNPASFCSKKCIEADQARCLDWASDWSNAFLVAIDACGDDPSCLDTQITAAPRTERQERFAVTYCASCGGKDVDACVASFWSPGKPGKSALTLSDAKLDETETGCLAGLEKHKGSVLGASLCAATFSSCQLKHLQSVTPIICRQRAR